MLPTALLSFYFPFPLDVAWFTVFFFFFSSDSLVGTQNNNKQTKKLYSFVVVLTLVFFFAKKALYHYRPFGARVKLESSKRKEKVHEKHLSLYKPY